MCLFFGGKDENMAAEKVQSRITLKGSAELVTDFFNFGINSIIYQRGIYPAESFTRVERYGIPLQMTDDDKLKIFISSVLEQLQKWLVSKEVHRLVLVIFDCHSKETLERWEFRIECEGEPETSENTQAKDLKVIQKEIRSVLRQIISSVSVLPLLNHDCSFDVLLYTNKDLEVPEEWAESTAHLIPDCEEICLTNFSTSVHRVNTAIQYKPSE